MSWGPLLVNLAVTAGLVAVLMLATFVYAMRTRVHAIMDTIWPASPIYMKNMLVRHTGKRLLEKHMARSRGAEYAEYVRRTSGFIPWPPR